MYPFLRPEFVNKLSGCIVGTLMYFYIGIPLVITFAVAVVVAAGGTIIYLIVL